MVRKQQKEIIDGVKDSWYAYNFKQFDCSLNDFNLQVSAPDQNTSCSTINHVENKYRILANTLPFL